MFSYCVSGPLAGALSKRFTARRTVIVFICIATSGLIAASLSTYIPALVVSFILASKNCFIETYVVNYFDKLPYLDQNLPTS